eukprot:1801800-Ditylum_brightwellii.AAC.1
MMNHNVNNIINTCMHQMIPCSAEEPTFASIKPIHKLLNQNATGKLHGEYENTLGLLGLALMTDAYKTLTGANFVLPTPPTPQLQPVLPPFASVHQATEENRRY